MNWFLYDNGLRHERVKQFLLVQSSYLVSNMQLQNFEHRKEKWNVKNLFETLFPVFRKQKEYINAFLPYVCIN